MSRYPARARRTPRLSTLGIGLLAAAILPLSCAPIQAPLESTVAAAHASEVTQAPPSSPVIEAITVDRSADDRGCIITILGVPEVGYTVVKNLEPLSLTVFLPSVGRGAVQKEMTIDNDLITSIRTEQRDAPSGPSSEITVGLKANAEHDVKLIGRALKVSVTPPSLAAREGAAAAAPSPQPAPIKKEELLTKAAPEQKPTATKIVALRVEKGEKATQVQILCDGAVETWKQFVLKDPLRLVVDIPGAHLVSPKSPMPVEDMPFSRVRTSQHGEYVRVVLDFLQKPLPPYAIRADKQMLVVVLGEAGPKEPARKPAAPGAQATAAPAPRAAAPEKPKPALAPVGRVESIEFKEIDNKTRIMVGLSEQSEFTLDQVSKDTLALSIKRCRIPSHLQRFIDTSFRYTSVARIIPETDKKDPLNARILIKLNKIAPYATTREGNNIYFDIEKPGEPPASVALVPRPSVFPEVKEKPPAARAEAPRAAADKPVAPAAPLLPAAPAEAPIIAPEEAIPGLVTPEPRIYTGRRISLDFQDAEITHLFRLIAEVSNLNIIAADNVKGKVTIRLIDVPWDQALDVILDNNKLGKEGIGNVIRIAPKAEIQAAREERLRQLKRQQDIVSEMQEKKAKAEPLTTRLVPVNFATAKNMVDQIKGLLSERGSVRTDERTNTLIITDVPGNVETATAMVQKLDTPTPQVLIEARVVEANTSFTRELGVQWGGRFLSSPSKGNAFNGNNIAIGGTSAGGQGPSGSNWIVNLPAAAGLGSGGALGLTLGNIMNSLLLDIQLSAMESSGAGRIVSNPKVTTLDNKQAIINQGSRIPYPKQTQDGISTEFIDATLNLTVTPHITFDGSIMMKIEIKKDQPDFGRSVLGVPAVDTKRATTEVLVKNGETTVIGGIVTSEDSASVSGVPWFNRLPFLGALFRTKRNVKNETELLIFITPRIVTPALPVKMG